MTKLRNTSRACIVEMTENSDDENVFHTMKLKYRETIMDDKLIPSCVGDIKHKEYSYTLPTITGREVIISHSLNYGVYLEEVVNRTFETMLGTRVVEFSSKNVYLNWDSGDVDRGPINSANCYVEKRPGPMAQTYSLSKRLFGKARKILVYASCRVSFSNGNELLLSGVATTEEGSYPGKTSVKFAQDTEWVTFVGSDVDINAVAREGGILFDNPSSRPYSVNRMYPEDIILFDILKPQNVVKACPPNGRFMAVVGTKLVARISGWAELLVAAIVSVVIVSWFFVEYSKKHITVMTIEQRLTSSLKSEVTGKGCNELPKNCRFGLRVKHTF